MRILSLLLLAVTFNPLWAEEGPDKRFALFAALTDKTPPRLVTFAPSQLDPRSDANQRRLKTSSIRDDLTALRGAFDGLVLYGYHEAVSPRLLAVAKELKFRVVLLAVWDIKSAVELDGVADLANAHQNDFALGVLVGNEGITFNRYEAADLAFAEARLRRKLPKGIPLGTSEPLVGYKHEFIRNFGDFLAPNIHPFFDRPKLTAEPAAAWAREEAANLAKLTQKPVILKETGFPHDGKPGYTPETQKEFWAAYVKPGLLARPTDSANAWVFHGVAFEAYDLPWKSEESKLPVEKSWGMLNPARKPYPAFAVWEGIGK
ncbi:glycoside hydrolase family 17 protein [Zavarzinella formosa]|uniref:hypothetical protein n=1 Tax=Zavarzinella formosa TaxID=360055 RepID=UPI0002D5DED6|nr:hypothetical protein [Zavarzinella formosa]